MSLVDDIAAVLPDLRAQAESRMVETCLVTRPGGGAGAWNPATRDYDPPAPVTVYSGRCEVQQANAQEQGVTAGEAEIDTQRYIVKLPILESVGVLPDDDVEITDATNDPDLIGKHLTVSATHHKTFATARRLPCVEVV